MAEKDKSIPQEWIYKTHKRMRRLKVNAQLYTMPDNYHEITKNQLLTLDKWMQEVLISQS